MFYSFNTSAVSFRSFRADGGNWIIIFFAYICSTRVWTVFQYLTSRDQVQVRTAGRNVRLLFFMNMCAATDILMKNPNAPQWLIVTVAMSWGEYGEDSHHQLGAQVLSPPTLWPYCTVFPLGRIRSAITGPHIKWNIIHGYERTSIYRTSHCSSIQA